MKYFVKFEDESKNLELSGGLDQVILEIEKDLEITGKDISIFSEAESCNPVAVLKWYGTKAEDNSEIDVTIDYGEKGFYSLMIL